MRAKKFERRQVYFAVTFSLASPLSDRKVPDEIITSTLPPIHRIPQPRFFPSLEGTRNEVAHAPAQPSLMSRKTSLYEHGEMSYSSVPVGFVFLVLFKGGGGGRRVLRFPGLVEHLSEFPELNCSLGYCVCEKDCSCNVADDRSFKANCKRWKIDHFCHPRSNLLGIPSPPPPFPSLSNRACHASYPRSGPNPAVRSQLGREKFARAMKVLREEESVRARKGVSYMAVFHCNINIYFEWWKFKTCFEDNPISVIETCVASAYARHFQTDMLYRKCKISMAPRHRM